MPAVLVLGGDGMLGHVVVDTLKHSVGIRVEHTTRNGQSGYQFDVEQGPARLRELLGECRVIEYVINCIGVVSARIGADRPGSVRQAIVANSVFPFDLALLASQAGIRVVHVSTDGVFSGRCADLYLEDSSADADDVYGLTKRLGEVASPDVINLRCSIVGPDHARRRGLLEWFLSRPDGSSVNGFVDHQWNGVTSRQFAELCAAIVTDGLFDRLRSEGAIHHYCPNETVSKYELLRLFQVIWNKEVSVRSATSGRDPLHRVLGTTRQTLPALFGHGRSMRDALQDLISSPVCRL